MQVVHVLSTYAYFMHKKSIKVYLIYSNIQNHQVLRRPGVQFASSHLFIYFRNETKKILEYSKIKKMKDLGSSYCTATRKLWIIWHISARNAIWWQGLLFQVYISESFRQWKDPLPKIYTYVSISVTNIIKHSSARAVTSMFKMCI